MHLIFPNENFLVLFIKIGGRFAKCDERAREQTAVKMVDNPGPPTLAIKIKKEETP